MKVLQILDFYLPYSTGGAEHSVCGLASGLGETADVSLSTITPDWGDSEIAVFGNWYKFWMPVEGREKNTVAQFWLVLPFFWFWSAVHIIRTVYKENPDVLHVHGKYMIPGTIIARLITHKPVIVTIRDYIPLCPYALCVFNRVRKHCSLREFLFLELPLYVRNYTSGGYLAWIQNLFSGLFGLAYSNILKLCLKFASEVVYLSKAQAKIYTRSGFEEGIVIGNCIKFDLKKLRKNTRDSTRILYVGKLSYGKGVDILLEAWKLLYATHPNWELVICGNGQLENWLVSNIAEHNLQDSVKLKGQRETKEIEEEYKKAAITVVPSVWPEPFGRVPIESLSCGTPVLVTLSGGLPENIKVGSTGWVVKPSVGSLVKGIVLAMKERNQVHENIRVVYPKLEERFGKDIIESHLKLYRGFV